VVCCHVPLNVCAEVVESSVGSENPAVYTVRSVTGKTVASAQIQSGETVLVDMSNFPKGLYIVNVNTQKGNYWAKVVKQ